MAYLVKETLNSNPRQYVLDGIVSDFRQKLLEGKALVRDERQNFWYTVEELIGEVPPATLKFVCPQCKTLIHGRKIDVGLSVKCGTCGHQALVPDLKAVRTAVLDRHLLKEAHRTMAYGAVLLLGGAGTTAATYLDAASRGGGGYVLFWGLIVIGAGLLIKGFGQRCLFFKKYPQGLP